jgi:hypothetical protein
LKLALAVVLLVLTSAPRLLAQPSNNAVAAEALFREGRALLERHELEAACDKLQASQKLDPAVGTLFSLGECFEQRDLLASSWFMYRAAVALALQRADRRQVLAQARADAIEPRVAKLHLVLVDRASTAEVTVDGDLLVLEALETPLPVDRGTHRVEARGEKSWSTVVQVPEDGVTVDVHVPSLAAPRSPPRLPAWKRPLALGLIDAGALTLGVGAIFGMQAIVKGRDVNAACPPPSSTCGNLSAVKSDGTAKTYADVATVALPVGAVVAADGGVLLATSHASVEASAGPSGARASVGWAW